MGTFVIRGLITLEEGLTAEGLLPDLSVLPGAHGGRRLTLGNIEEWPGIALLRWASDGVLRRTSSGLEWSGESPL